MAPGPVAAAVTRLPGSFAGSAATGIAEFFGRRAGVAVAHRTRNVLVLLAAGAGMQGGGFLFARGFSGIVGLCIFWHSFTNRTVAVR